MWVKLENNWRGKTISALEKRKSKDVEFDSYLIKQINELEQKPLNSFTVEDLRLMIRQQIGLQYLIPLAIEILEANLFAEGDFYEGDLLQAVLNVDSGFWIDNGEYRAKLSGLIEKNSDEIREKKIETRAFMINKQV